MPTATPTLIWAQRYDKVFITWESVSAKDVQIDLSDWNLSLVAKSADGKQFELNNMPLSNEIDVEASKWSANDRCVLISLKKKDAQWWDTLSKSKDYKRFIKVDFSKWCEEEDKEYVGQFDEPGGGMDMGGMMGGGMGGMDMGGMGGMGGMDMSALQGMMGGGMGGGDFADDDDDDDADLDDLKPEELPDDLPPPLEGAN